MVNAWSLAGSILAGTFEKDYPVMDKTKGRWSDDKITPNESDEIDFYEYNFIDDQYSHYFLEKELDLNLDDQMTPHFFKYHEEEILKDVKEYVTNTYQGHYTGNSHEYRKVQTIDLMASKDLAASFCQANILKYGSRYGNKDGKNQKDLMKVIHYAMLLLHFDGHYGEPSMPSGNFEQMP